MGSGSVAISGRPGQKLDSAPPREELADVTGNCFTAIMDTRAEKISLTIEHLEPVQKLKYPN